MSTPGISAIAPADTGAAARAAPAARAPANAAPAATSAATGAAVLKALSAAVKEATETPAQTLKEASGGDRQAQKLLHHGPVGTKINTVA